MRYRKTFREAWADVHRNRGSRHVGAKEEPSNKEEPSKEKSSGDEIQNLKNQIQMLKVALENEKIKVVKPQPNKDTGEVPLRTGIAQAILDKDTPKPKAKKEKKEIVSIGKGQTKIEVDPEVKMGIHSGGATVDTGNLH